jgi:hypothetical protein
MAYEIFQREIVRASTPSVTLNKRGKLVLNVAATKIFHDAGVDNVFLMWDSERRKFALKETAKKDPRTVTLRYSSNSKWAAISAKGFLQKIGHDLSKTVSYPATWNENEGMLEISMTGQEVLPIEEAKADVTKGKASVRWPVAKKAAAR